MKPIIIAITADTYPHPTDQMALRRAPFASRGIMEAVAACGAVPVLLPDVEGAKGEDYVDLADGLIIPGGPNMDPRFYGEEPVWALGRTNYRRDVFEMEIFRAFHEAGKPIFGICRGCQVINVAMGGDTYQDIRTGCPTAYIKHKQEAAGDEPTHHVDVVEGSLLAQSIGTRAYVNSRHHQAVHHVGKGLTVTAKAPDGLIEAIESDDKEILAVQWHPEDLWRSDPSMKRLFEDFIRRAAGVGA